MFNQTTIDNNNTPVAILRAIRSDIKAKLLIDETLGAPGNDEGCMLGLVFKNAGLDRFTDPERKERPYPEDAVWNKNPASRTAATLLANAALSLGLADMADIWFDRDQDFRAYNSDVSAVVTGVNDEVVAYSVPDQLTWINKAIELAEETPLH